MSNLSTAFALQQGISEIVFSDEVMIYAAEIAKKADFNPEVLELIMKYTSTLSAGVATKVVEIVMPKSEFSSMMKELKEMQEIGDSIE